MANRAFPGTVRLKPYQGRCGAVQVRTRSFFVCSSVQDRKNYGVTVADVGVAGVGVLVGVKVPVGVGVRVGVTVRVTVAVREGVRVEDGVWVGLGVGASP